ncbi:hypothetical protein N8I84_33415 [Streptomyces cynarae]|uniref:Uncharacterized protein n=1 Tax=Streptomyces cynarae TaxID=2981134 RepID=A0ABY6E8P5_9ACTN|nr:hypothetical protein [Streptomyces cynarae]UXY23056.1 hypothetical protein N8I84_33415 [Streptomyces cynarae]
MDPRRRRAARRAEKKIPKNLRPHRLCPHCGQIQPGKLQTLSPHKPGGTRRRREKTQETAEPTATTGQRTAPEPIDAKTVIQGVVDRIPAALEGANADGMPSATAVGVAVRKAVLDEFRTRAQFAGRLAEIDALVWAQAEHGGDLLGGALREHLRELRILRVTEPEASDRFVVTEGEGEAFEVLRPAYVDEVTGKVILAGHLRRVPGSAVGEEA